MPSRRDRRRHRGGEAALAVEGVDSTADWTRRTRRARTRAAARAAISVLTEPEHFAGSTDDLIAVRDARVRSRAQEGLSRRTDSAPRSEGARRVGRAVDRASARPNRPSRADVDRPASSRSRCSSKCATSESSSLRSNAAPPSSASTTAISRRSRSIRQRASGSLDASRRRHRHRREWGRTSRADVERVARRRRRCRSRRLERVSAAADPAEAVRSLTGVPRICSCRIEIKFCGMTRAEDAREAARLGASYVGVIFAGGPRQVTIDRAARCSAACRTAVRRVGVFSSEHDEIIGESARRARICTSYSCTATATRTMSRRCVGASAARCGRCCASRMDDCRYVPRSCSTPPTRVLLDAKVPGKLGGTGVTLPWEELREQLDRFAAQGQRQARARRRTASRRM